MMRLAGRPRVMAVIGEPIWVMNPICFDARAAKAVRACIVTGRSSSPRSRNIPFFQVTYSGNQVALFVGTPIWTEVGVSVWAPYGKLNRKMIAADRLMICLIELTSYPFRLAVSKRSWRMSGSRNRPFGQIQDYTVGIGKRILTNSTAIHIFVGYVHKDPTGNVLRNRRWKGSC